MNDNNLITKITISVLFMQGLLLLDSSKPRWGHMGQLFTLVNNKIWVC
jgi:hypothetical protein